MSIGSVKSQHAVISRISRTPVIGAQIVEAKKALIPTAQKAIGFKSNPMRFSVHAKTWPKIPPIRRSGEKRPPGTPVA